MEVVDLACKQDKLPNLRWKPELRDAFRTSMSWSPLVSAHSVTDNINSLCKNLCLGIKTAAEHCNMLKPTYASTEHTNKPWFDKDCYYLKQKVILSLKLCKSACNDRLAWKYYHFLKSDFYSLIELKKTEHVRQIRQKFYNVGNPTEFWKVIRSARGFSPHLSIIPLREWEKFLNSIYPARSTVSFSFPNTEVFTLDDVITLKELIKSLSKVTQNKAAGSDGILNECSKELPNNWLLYTLTLYKKILESGTTPSDWSSVIMCMLHKKGDATDPNNYRDIALVKCLTKVFTQILHDRIKKWAEENNLIPEEQAGFALWPWL